MSGESIAYLLERYLNQEATDAEIAALAAWIEGSEEEEKLTLLENAWNGFEIREPMREEHMNTILAGILEERTPAPGIVRELVPGKRPSRRRIVYRAAAAVIILFLAGGGWLFWNARKTGPADLVRLTQLPPDIAPGGNKAVLTLGNGSKIILDSAGRGFLAEQGSSRISKLDNGTLAYESPDGRKQGARSAAGDQPPPSGELLYNTLSTPRGGQYQLRLPDGTLVWLNAASSITYPTAFKGSTRKVIIRGEAYFEVAQNKQQPFEVETDGLAVQVLGTHFNINAYPEEKIVKTTLLEGSVRLRSDAGFGLLSPGQQGQVLGGGTLHIVQGVDLEQVMAWKNGLFDFNHADVGTIMRQLSRWYDVEVEYQGTIPHRDFRGKIQRDLQLSQVLKFLEQLDVHLSIDGKKIVVRP